MPRPPLTLWRAVAAAAAALLLLSLFCPWSEQTAVARGVSGLRTLSSAQNGWQLLGAAQLIAALAAVACLVLCAGRRTVRGATGPAIAAVGAIAALAALWTLVSGSGTVNRGYVAVTDANRWGVFVALVAGALLVYAGLQLRLAYRRAAAAAVAQSGRAPILDEDAAFAAPVLHDRRHPASPERRRGLRRPA